MTNVVGNTAHPPTKGLIQITALTLAVQRLWNREREMLNVITLEMLVIPLSNLKKKINTILLYRENIIQYVVNACCMNRKNKARIRLRPQYHYVYLTYKQYIAWSRRAAWWETAVKEKICPIRDFFLMANSRKLRALYILTGQIYESTFQPPMISIIFFFRLTFSSFLYRANVFHLCLKAVTFSQFFPFFLDCSHILARYISILSYILYISIHLFV